MSATRLESSSVRSTVADLRTRLAVTPAQLALLLGTSARGVAALERGDAPNPPLARRLADLESLIDALTEVLRPGSIGPWLLRPNPAFEGLTPAEVIDRGAGERVREMVYLLRSGTPF